MKKTILLICLSIIIILLLIKLEKADNYIKALEKDFPEYIDITAEGDEYTQYYKSIIE